MFTAFYAGFSLSISLILAIGAQNAYVLRLGLRNEHVFLVCLFCAMSDATLILVGVFGFQALTEFLPQLAPYMTLAGALYLLLFGLKSFYAAFKSTDALVPSEDNREALSTVMMTLALVTWLNPHVYLDTVLLLGSISLKYTGVQIYFAAGAVLASFVFFFTLGFGARLLRPMFAKPAAWRILEFIIGLVMVSLAVMLILT